MDDEADGLSGGRKIILHAGLPKTGTSTIQNVCYGNRAFLLEQEGVLYPSLEPNLSTPLRTMLNDDAQKQIVNKMAGFTNEEVAARRQSYFELLDAEISSREWDTLLLSAEGISNLFAHEMAKLREWGEQYASEWTVLLCVRHPVDYVRSVIQQLLKGGETLQERYENLPSLGYSARISRAISVFGRENVKVFDFESAVKGDGGIVGNFARQAGLTTSSCNFLASRTDRYNESLSLEAAQILDSLNRQHPMFVGGVRTSRRAGPSYELPYINRIKGRKFDIPDSVKDEIRLRSREDILWLNEEFGFDLYRDVTSFRPQEESREQPMGTLSDPAVDTIAGVIGDLVTAEAFRRVLNEGRTALRKGDLGRAENTLRTAARLDPDAQQPKELLKKVTAGRSRASDKQRPEDPHKASNSNANNALPAHKKIVVAIRSWLKKRA